MPEPEPYFTWEDVARVLKGEKRLKQMLLPSIEDADEHPVFDENYAIVVDMAEAELQSAGYSTPLTTPLTDESFRNAMIGVFLGLITQASSDREPFVDQMEAAGKKTMQRIGRGELHVKGATQGGTSAEGNEGAFRIGFNSTRHLDFDRDSPDSGINDVFSDISPFGSRRF